MTGGDATAPTRLIPLWFTTVVVAFLSLFTVAFGIIGIVASGPMATTMLATAVATGGGLMAALASLARRRPRRPLTPDPDGEVVITSPLPVTVGLLVAWGALLVVAILTARAAVTDFGAIEAPGASLVMVVGAVGMLPDLARLVTGRLHRWTVRLTADGLGYRGYRTSVFVPWREVRKVAIQRRGPAGVRVETRQGPVVLPAAAFTVPADQLVQEIRARAARR